MRLAEIKRLLGDRHPLRLGWHWLKAFAAALRYGFPARKLTIIGITGTDGKTTTVAMTAHILHAAGIPVGAVSTSFFRIKDKTEENPTHKTSLSPAALQSFLRRCMNEGCTHAVVECSSHGLVQHRLDFLWPAVAAVTNTSVEHLDYHGTMEQYRSDKGVLFRMLRGRGAKILNAKDETYGIYGTIPSQKTTTYSRDAVPGKRTREQSDIRLWLSDISSKSPTPSAALHAVESGPHSAKESLSNLELQIPGEFNLDNALCAIACGNAAGVSLEVAAGALRDFPGVPGRMEIIDEGQPYRVFVDFTVSPKAYEETLSAARKLLSSSGRLLVLTGSCGDRMREKRPMIGRIVSSLADVVVVSEDETVSEDPLKVMDEVWTGIDQTRCEAKKIPDRREAIRFLLTKARAGDAVLLCGMGACTTMQTREGLRPWDEREIARTILKEF